MEKIEYEKMTPSQTLINKSLCDEISRHMIKNKLLALEYLEKLLDKRLQVIFVNLKQIFQFLYENSPNLDFLKLADLFIGHTDSDEVAKRTLDILVKILEDQKYGPRLVSDPKKVAESIK